MLGGLQPPTRFPRATSAPPRHSPPSPARTERASRRIAPARSLAGVTLVAALLAMTARAEDSSPFTAHAHDIRGRVLQAWPLAVTTCADDASDLLVLSSEGGPPTQKRFATWMPCGSALVPGDPRIRVRAIPEAAVLVDVARIPGRAGSQLVSVSAAGLRIEALDGEPAPIDRPIPGGLPLPPRPWEIGRVPLVDAWNDDGKPMALVPALAGAWLVDLASGATRQIELPIYASYESYAPFLPDTVWKWLGQDISWPVLERGDDDGDGRRDLVALSRWTIAFHHAGPDGLPSKPSRSLALVPFDEKAERRPPTSVHNYFARDLDGDTRVDLVLSTLEGGLMDGRSTTRIHLNPGHGATLDGPPAAVLETHGGFSGVDFIDLEGDGVLELIETGFEFGVLQLVRLLVTQRAETTVRILALDRASPGGTRTLFEDRLAFSLDFKESRFAGVLPSFGDWNGDGLLDLFVQRGRDALAFRLGSRAPELPRFGSPVGRQPQPLESGESRVADLDGDGLDDIVVFTTSEPEPPLVVLENRGRLPGTHTSLRPR